jgi:anti-sigma B factor antagonist
VRREDDLRISTTTEGDLVALSVDGNLDYYTAPLFRQRVDDILDDEATIVEVRLGVINLIDSSGLSALICAYKLARARGKALVLRGDTETVARLLRRTSLDRVLPLRPPRPPSAGAGSGASAASA